MQKNMKFEDKEAKYTEYDLAEDLIGMVAIAPERMDYMALQGFFHNVIEMTDKFARDKETTKLEIESLKAEHMKDERLQTIATEFNLTMNQVHGFMELTDQMNKQLPEGSGIVVVPFWFYHEQVELKNLNEQLTINSENLEKTISKVAEKVQQSKEIKLTDLMEHRSNIITGVQSPYIPGVTGPMPGDEHLDEENIYNYLPTKGK